MINPSERYKRRFRVRNPRNPGSMALMEPSFGGKSDRLLEDELDNRLADEALAEDAEGVPIESLFERMESQENKCFR